MNKVDNNKSGGNTTEGSDSGNTKIPAMIIGGALIGNIIAPGIGGAIIGGVVGGIVGRAPNSSRKDKKRAK